MDYLDFELEIGPGSGGIYPLAVRSPAGEARESMHFPFDDQTLANQLLALKRAVLNSGTTSPQSLATEVQAVQSFGQALFNALFFGEVRSLYAVSRNQAVSQGKGLRLKLRIQATELAALPWEFLFNPNQAEYLCLSDYTPVVRYVELPQAPQVLTVTPPLRILGMTASPKDLASLDIEREKQRIEQALAGPLAKGLVQLTWLEGRTWEDVQRAMRAGPWHIFHFIGHGGFNPNTKEGMIALEDNAGQARYLNATQLGLLLTDHHALRLIVLNSCEGAHSSTGDIFSSTAATLVRRGMPAVLAMQYAITDEAAIVFSRFFYEALAEGIPVDTAVSEARKALNLGVAHTVEWGTPVLYMRSPDGILFELQPPPSTPSSSPATVVPTEKRPSADLPGHPLSPLDRKNRMNLLKRVRATWIEGVLEHSLHQATLIALDLQEQPDALANPWQLEVQETNLPAQSLPAGTPIVQVYDDAGGELLILGEPGAGKTTLLLETARALLDRAQQDVTLPLPVVFNLSSWAVKHQPITVWLVDELDSKYQVPRKLGRSWVESHQILPLLDGLDEVAPAARNQCIETINSYRQMYPQVQVVVCSRSTEYRNQPTQLRLDTAVVVQPLTQQQINAYLESAGEQAEALREALRQDADLHELATTPLMLSILLFAYKEPSPDKISELTSLEAKREQLFTSYVQHMLKRRGASKLYQPQQITHCLTYLAQQMKRQNQTVFYIEQMQPGWLPKKWQHYVDRALAGGVSGGLLGGLLGVAVGVIFVSLFLLSSPLSRADFGQGIDIGLNLGLTFGLTLGLILGLFHLRGTEIRPAEVITWSWANARVAAIASIVGGSLGFLILFHSIPFIAGFFFMEGSVRFLFPGPTESLSNALLISLLLIPPILLAEICFILISLFARSNLEEGRVIVSRPRIWSAARRGALVGIYTGYIGFALLTLISSIASRLVGNTAISHDIYLVAVGCVSGLITGLIYGVSSAQLETRKSFKPNQGIWRSLSNGGRILFIVGLFSWLAFDLPVIVKYRLNVDAQPGTIIYFPSNQFLAGIGAALSIGVFFGLLNGGIACIKHLLLRIFLWQARTMPWNCTRFFDYAAERILLRKVGGGYIFVHRLLLEHFALLATPVLEDLSAIREPPPATSSTPQIDSTQREEKAAAPIPSRKMGFNKEKRIAALFAALLVVVFLLLNLRIGPSTFGAVQHFGMATPFTENFQDNQHGWTVTSMNGLTASSPSNGTYMLATDGSVTNLGYLFPHPDPAAVGTLPDKFTLKVQMAQNAGDLSAFYGLAFRFREDSNNVNVYSYAFVINSHGEYRVWKFDPNAPVIPTPLWSGSHLAAIHSGLHQSNTLVAVVQGSSFSFKVNDMAVPLNGGSQSITDSSSPYTGGQLALLVSGSNSQYAASRVQLTIP